MKFSAKRAIHFDLDGTLIDSVPDLALAVNDMLVKLHKSPFSETTIRGWVGNGSQMLVKRALLGTNEVDESALDPSTFQEAHRIFLEAYAAHLCEATTPYPQVVETLQALKARGYRLSIITNKPAQFVAPILQHLGFEGLIDAYLGGDSLPQKKPHPMPLTHMCERMGVSVEESVMVGDSKNDILAANACGMQSIGVSYGYNYGEDICTYNPTVVVERFDQILQHFA